MSVKRYASQFKVILKQQGIFFPVLAFCVIIVFPAVILGYYMPKDFKEELFFLKIIELMIPMLAPFWEIQLLYNWSCKKGSEIYFFVEPHPWKQAFTLDIMYLLFVTVAYSILSFAGMDTKGEGLKMILLCLIIQNVALLLLNMLKSIALSIGASEALVYLLCFTTKSPFYLQLENPYAPKHHLVQISLIMIFLLILVNILVFRFKNKVS